MISRNFCAYNSMYYYFHPVDRPMDPDRDFYDKSYSSRNASNLILHFQKAIWGWVHDPFFSSENTLLEVVFVWPQLQQISVVN